MFDAYLERVDDRGGLHFVVEIGKTEDDFLARPLFARYQPHGLEAGEGTEDVCIHQS